MKYRLHYLALFIIFAHETQSPKALNIKIEIHAWKGYGMASEILNVSESLNCNRQSLEKK